MSVQRQEGEARVREAVRRRQERKLRKRREAHQHIWFGLGMFGMVGWSVAVPVVVGIALGVWLDRHHPARFSWTLTLLVAGMSFGCWNAWRWVSQERERGAPQAAPGKKEEDRHG